MSHARLGKYRLVQRLAVGGVAEVYLAIAEGAGGFAKQVVLKRLQPARARDAAVVAMFLDEARLMALFRHPHIAEVYDIGIEGAERFFALEFVDGCDLRDLLDQRAGAPLPWPAAKAILRAVGLGLGHAHAQRGADGAPLGVVHRDVSPSNVLVGRGGEVKLIDFGVAKWASQRSQTEHGTLKGKFAYMSPEQCRGESLDARSDLFALGVLAYELTTGRRPFAARSDFDVMAAIVAGAFPPPAEIVSDYPAIFAALIGRALARRPEDRFASAAEFILALDEAAKTMGVGADAIELAGCVAASLAARPAATSTPALGSEAAGPGWERTATEATPAPTRPSETSTSVEAHRGAAPATTEPRPSDWLEAPRPPGGLSPSHRVSEVIAARPRLIRPWGAVVVMGLLLVITNVAWNRWRAQQTPATTEIAAGVGSGARPEPPPADDTTPARPSEPGAAKAALAKAVPEIPGSATTDSAATTFPQDAKAGQVLSATAARGVAPPASARRGRKASPQATPLQAGEPGVVGSGRAGAASRPSSIGREPVEPTQARGQAPTARSSEVGASATGGAAAVRIWDPDSPLPP